MKKPFKIEVEAYEIDTILTALLNELDKQPKKSAARMFLEEALKAVQGFTANN